MTLDEFARVRYFRPEEWAPLEPIDSDLVYAVDNWRAELGASVVIHEAYAEDGHVHDSQHYVGRAVDLHVVGRSLVEAWLSAESHPTFTGIGVYPYWEHPGLHLDIRHTATR